MDMETANNNWAVLDDLSWSCRSCASEAEVELVAQVSLAAITGTYGVTDAANSEAKLPWWIRYKSQISPVPFPFSNVTFTQTEDTMEDTGEPTASFVQADDERPLWENSVACELQAREHWGLNLPFCSETIEEKLMVVFTEYLNVAGCSYRMGIVLGQRSWRRVSPVHVLDDPHQARLFVLLNLINTRNARRKDVYSDQVKFVREELNEPSVLALTEPQIGDPVWQLLAMRVYNALRHCIPSKHLVKLPVDIEKRWRALRPFWDSAEESWCCHAATRVLMTNYSSWARVLAAHNAVKIQELETLYHGLGGQRPTGH